MGFGAKALMVCLLGSSLKTEVICYCQRHIGFNLSLRTSSTCGLNHSFIDVSQASGPFEWWIEIFYFLGRTLKT
jgi:hypothetical protein